MKILGLDSSGLVASVAIVEDDNLCGVYTVNYKKTHSQTLLPMLDEVAKMIELDMSSIDAIAIAGGPGSFTGLRIGSATAKRLGLDARRNQAYTGLYSFDGNEMTVVKEQCAVAIEEIVAAVNEQGRSVVFLGDGVPVFSSYISEHCKVPYIFAPAHMNKQNAAAVAALGIRYMKEGRMETAAEHKPEYLRLSQAERERMEAGK